MNKLSLCSTDTEIKEIEDVLKELLRIDEINDNLVKATNDIYIIKCILCKIVDCFQSTFDIKVDFTPEFTELGCCPTGPSGESGSCPIPVGLEVNKFYLNSCKLVTAVDTGDTTVDGLLFCNIKDYIERVALENKSDIGLGEYNGSEIPLLVNRIWKINNDPNKYYVEFIIENYDSSNIFTRKCHGAIICYDVNDDIQDEFKWQSINVKCRPNGLKEVLNSNITCYDKSEISWLVSNSFVISYNKFWDIESAGEKIVVDNIWQLSPCEPYKWVIEFHYDDCSPKKMKLCYHFNYLTCVSCTDLCTEVKNSCVPNVDECFQLPKPQANQNDLTQGIGKKSGLPLGTLPTSSIILPLNVMVDTDGGGPPGFDPYSVVNVRITKVGDQVTVLLPQINFKTTSTTGSVYVFISNSNANNQDGSISALDTGSSSPYNYTGPDITTTYALTGSDAAGNTENDTGVIFTFYTDGRMRYAGSSSSLSPGQFHAGSSSYTLSSVSFTYTSGNSFTL